MLHTMPPRISDEEKQRRKEGALAVLRDARDDQFQAVKDLEAHIGRELDITAGAARSLLSDVLNALPQGHALLQTFDAIKARSSSSSGRSAANRLGQSGAGAKNLVQARQERTAYAAARRRLPTTRATGQRLLREINVATKATAASIEQVISARVECACISGLDDAVEDFETAVGLAGSVGAVKVAPGGFCFVRKDLVKYGGQRADAFVDEQAAAFRKEDANERAYLAATGPAARVSFPDARVMVSAIKAARVDGRPDRVLLALERDVLQSLYLQAQAVKDKRPSRAAKTVGDEARHVTAADAYGGTGAVLWPPVALAREPGHFVRVDDSPRHLEQRRRQADDRAENIEKIADGLEIKHGFRCPARVVVMPERASDEYGRLAPTPLDTGDKLQLAKILVRLRHGRFMLAALRANREPILLVVGRGFIMDMFVGIRGPPIEAADAATRLRSSTGPGDAVSFKHYRKYRGGAASMVAALRRVIVQMRLSGGDVAALVNRVMEQIDGRCEELAAGEAPTRGGVVPIYDSEDEGLGECPTGVDAADWATLKKGTEARTFARLALASDFAAAASGLLGSLRGGAPGDKCGSGDGTQDVQVPTGGEAPPADPNAGPPPPGARRSKKSRRFAGEEAGADAWINFKAGPLDFDWATKANVTGAPAWAKPIKKGERLVEFWLRFSQGAAASIDQEYVVLHSSDAAPADISGLVAKVDQCAAARKAQAGVEPAAKRRRGTAVEA